jgi:hypothetical protein
MNAQGGKRPNSGRPSGHTKYGEPSVAMRVPASMVKDVESFIRKTIEIRKQVRERRSFSKISYL